MLHNYLTSALRSFRKNKLHSSITLLGLALGLMTSLLALLFVIDESSFDNFQSDTGSLYRLNKYSKDEDGSTFKTAETSGMMGPTMRNEFGEVENIVRYLSWFNPVVFSNKDRNIELGERDIIIVDSTFFQLFDFELVRGDEKTVLTRPGTVVLTEALATALFGDEDPVGKTITGIDNLEFEVTGVAKEAPRNSHIQYKAVLSWSTTVPQLGGLPMEWMNNWIAQGINTYIKLKPGADASALAAKFPKFMQDHMPTRVDSYALYLQPFSDVYLESSDVKFHQMAKAGSRQYVMVFSVIAGFILFIACVNYINISTSKATRRAREVGMRKSLGATKNQLVKQFLGESLISTVCAAVVALALLYIIVPYFNDLAGKSLPLSLIWNPMSIAGLVALILAVSFVAGVYPAFVLSAFRPSEVLKSNGRSKLTGHWPRQVLITFQFAISIVMIAGTVLVYQQMNFILSKDLGFDKDHVLVLTLTPDMIPKGRLIAEEVSHHPSVVSTSIARSALGMGGASTRIQPEGFPPDEVEVRMFPCDGNFLKTYDLEMASGRFFNVPEQASDSGAYIINETLAKQLKWDNPLEKTIRFNANEAPLPVIGVLKDFNFTSLYEEVDPLVMWVSPRSGRNLSIRFSGNPKELIAFLEVKWKEFENRYPFRYTFVDDAFARSYQSEEKLFKTVMTFAGLSLVIACLGLYGLVSFTLEQRTKEIGIRKVMGATVMGLNLMVNRKFMLLVAAASVIAVPVVIPLMDKWLDKFAFRIDIGAGVFVTAIGLTFVVTLLAVSLQALKAAMMNPADALRTE